MLLEKIEIPMTLSSPNVKKHWAIKARENKNHRKVISQYWLVHMQRFKHCGIMDFLPIHIVLTRHAARQMDAEDNLPMAFKHIKDQLAALILDIPKMGIADGDPRLSWEYKQTPRLKPNQNHITIELYATRFGLGKMPC